MKTVLYIADPNSIHDVKWISTLTQYIQAIWLPRKHHQKSHNLVDMSAIVGYVPDFSIARFWQTLLGARKIKRMLKTHGADIIHVMYAEPSALWCIFRNYFGVPMVVTCRGTDVLKTIPEAFSKKNLLNRIVAHYYSRAFQKADFVTGTSVRQLDSVNKFSGRTHNTSIVRTGVDIKRLKSDTSKYFPSSITSSYLLFPRFIKPLYNHEFCLEAIELLPKQIKDHYQMVFVGKDAGDLEYQAMLEDRMNSLVNVGFVFLPKQPQESLFELYKRASAVVMTPLSDGSPVSAMEALICGRPVILGPLEYDKDLFEGKTHILKEWDANKLAKLMEYVLSNGSIHLTLEDIERIDTSWNMGQVKDIYEKLINDK